MTSTTLVPAGLRHRHRDGRPRGQDVEQGPHLGHGAHRGGVHRRDQLAHLQAAGRRPAGLHLGHLGAGTAGGIGPLHPEPAVHHPVLGPQVVGHAHDEVAREEGGGGRARFGVVEDAEHGPVGVEQRLAGHDGRRGGRRGDGRHGGGGTAGDGRADGGHRARRAVQRNGVAIGGHECEDHVGITVVEVGIVGEGRHRQVLGHVHQRHIGRLVHGHHRGGLERAGRADHVEVAQAGQEIGRRGDEPALGDGHPDEQDRAVGRRRLQLHHGVPGRVGRGRQRVLHTGQGRQRAVGGVLRGGFGGVVGRGGEQNDDPGHDSHDRPDPHQHHDGAPVVVVARGREQGRGTPDRAGAGHLTGVAPQPVIGVYPAPEGSVGLVRARFRRPHPGPAHRLRAPRARRSLRRRYRERPGKCRRPTARPYHEAACHATWPSISGRPTRLSTPRERAWS